MEFCRGVHVCTLRHERAARDAVAHAGSRFVPLLGRLDVLNPPVSDAMAPKATDAACASRDVPLPEARRNDWGEIARFLATANQLTDSGT